jgi:hypothetical protein
VVTAGRTAPASSWPGSTHGRRGKLHGVLEEGLGGWDIPRSWQKKGPGAVASNGGRRCAARRPAATRAAGEPRPLNRRSCHREGVTASVRGRRRSQGIGGGDVRACGRVRWRLRWRVGEVGFARPVSVWRVATQGWARTLVQGLGTDGHNGVPASVPGRRRGQRGPARDVVRGRELTRLKFEWPCSNVIISNFSN